jgi:hypothetical protein
LFIEVFCDFGLASSSLSQVLKVNRDIPISNNLIFLFI